MRMRRKRNLDERLSAVSDYIIERTILDLNMKTSVEKKDYIDYMYQLDVNSCCFDYYDEVEKNIIENIPNTHINNKTNVA